MKLSLKCPRCWEWISNVLDYENYENHYFISAGKRFYLGLSDEAITYQPYLGECPHCKLTFNITVKLDKNET